WICKGEAGAAGTTSASSGGGAGVLAFKSRIVYHGPAPNDPARRTVVKANYDVSIRKALWEVVRKNIQDLDEPASVVGSCLAQVVGRRNNPIAVSLTLRHKCRPTHT